MSNFEPTFLKLASRYLEEKLQEERKKNKPKAYKLEEEKKERGLLKFLHSFFRS
ncbi:MAG: hypothetical protein PHU40_03785 [Sulfurimonas sp.]|nr:hypothetical protein [Sulfurimonas sp.]